MSQAGEWAWANPATAVGAALVVGGATVIASPAIVSVPVLSAAGFVPGVAQGMYCRRWHQILVPLTAFM